MEDDGSPAHRPRLLDRDAHPFSRARTISSRFQEATDRPITSMQGTRNRPPVTSSASLIQRKSRLWLLTEASGLENYSSQSHFFTCRLLFSFVLPRKCQSTLELHRAISILAEALVSAKLSSCSLWCPLHCCVSLRCGDISVPTPSPSLAVSYLLKVCPPTTGFSCFRMPSVLSPSSFHDGIEFSEGGIESSSLASASTFRFAGFTLSFFPLFRVTGILPCFAAAPWDSILPAWPLYCTVDKSLRYHLGALCIAVYLFALYGDLSQVVPDSVTSVVRKREGGSRTPSRLR